MWLNRSCLLLVELCISAIIVAERSAACCEDVERVEPLTHPCEAVSAFILAATGRMVE